MNVGVYNRWLSTLGGGERYGLSIAQALARKHHVQVISHVPMTATQVGDRLNMDLSGVRFVTVPEQRAEQLGPLTAHYDLFVNASNLDFIPTQAQRSAMVIFFPMPSPQSPGARVRRRVAKSIRKWAGLPILRAGVFGEMSVGPAKMRGLAQQAVIELPLRPRGYDVTFKLAPALTTPVQARISIDGNEQMAVTLPPRTDGVPASLAPCRIHIPPRSRQQKSSLCIEGESLDGREPILLLSEFQPDHTGYSLYHQLFERWFPGWGLRLQNQLPENLVEIVRGYERRWAISGFTQQWTQRYWGVGTTLLHPPVAVEEFEPGNKQKQILSVGRFFAGSHNKKHDVLIDVFKQMVDAGLAEWQLHLAGGAMPGAPHEAYLRRLRARAAGYPISIHTDLAFEDLVQLYGSSSIYWHASGFGENEEKEPIKFEHFGITTVEAMAARCVPVVIGKGGQAELIEHNRTGYLWYTTEQLRELTLRLVENPDMLDRMGKAAQDASSKYNRQQFDVTLGESLSSLGVTV